MKKGLILLSVVLLGGMAMAQDTVTYPCSRYMNVNVPYDTNEGHYLCERGHRAIGGRCFNGMVYHLDAPQLVYGVAVVGGRITHTNDPLSVRIAQKIEGEGWRFLDSTMWRWARPPDRYIKFIRSGLRCENYHDSVCPVYEIYFDHAIYVNDSFAVGSGYYYSDRNLYPVVGGAPKYLEANSCDINSEYRSQYVTSEDGVVMNPGVNINTRGFLCIFPIIVPPDTDSYICAGVDSVRVQGSGTGWVNVAWASGSDDQDLFQIAYGVRGEDPDHYASVTNQESPRVIFDDAIDTGVYYSVRVRGRCHHRCAVHDTLMWGPWSDLVHFYVGNHEPGTGIAAPEATIAFTLSPNPTSGEVTVVLPPLGEGAVLTVTDATGREVRRQTLPPTTEASRLRLDLKGLPAGAYFVTLVTPQGSHTEKLVIGDE